MARRTMAAALLRDALTGRMSIWYMQGATRSAYNAHPVPAGYEVIGKGAFDDGRFGDLLLRDPASGEMQLMMGTGFAFEPEPLLTHEPYGPEWWVMGVGP